MITIKRIKKQENDKNYKKKIDKITIVNKNTLKRSSDEPVNYP